MENVELISSGYEWICPECEERNKEIEVTTEVTCPNCGKHFRVHDFIHAFGNK